MSGIPYLVSEEQSAPVSSRTTKTAASQPRTIKVPGNALILRALLLLSRP